MTHHLICEYYIYINTSHLIQIIHTTHYISCFSHITYGSRVDIDHVLLSQILKNCALIKPLRVGSKLAKDQMCKDIFFK